ncbi:hypothetical protein EC973_001175 [Apophysomyces ossiformis]|uniref:Translation initiation factor eIF2B subunit epsilon n=1 Tax=Apophysomyces ossiformis TaxID=679940 RepID=A0A8H7BPE1_9FUNG|nr:hypothetical protein EC973_001175 [Apophysomyces ossiformis]
MSVGDVLRELDARQLITTDFILTTGDLVSNMKLDKALEAHRARKRTDKNSIMTLVLKEASRSHAARAKDMNGVFVLDPNTNKCLFYESTESLPMKKRIEMSSQVFENHAQIELRNDLVDPRLDICSVEVPALFTENFDWQRLRRDFVHGILTSDILGKTIYTEVVSEPYIARVQNEQLYAAITRHVLNRWSFPVVPETNLKAGDDYEFFRGNVYKSKNVVLSRSCIIDDNVQIGAGTVIGENTRISNSVIGRNCRIGANVVLDGVYLWDDVVIHDNCRASRSILAHNVTLLEGSQIEYGSLIAHGVTLGPDEHIPKYSRLSLHPQPKDEMFGDDSDEEEQAADEQGHVLTGDHKPVYFWKERVGEDDDMDPRNVKLGSLAFNMADLVLHDDDLSDSASEIGDLSDVESDDGSMGGGWNVQSSKSTAQSSEEFRKEIAQTIARSLSENHTPDTAALEITGLRMSHDGSYIVVREEVIPAIIDHIDTSSPGRGLRPVLTKWCPLIGKVTHGLEDQVHVLQVLQKHCATQESLSRVFLAAIQLMYDADVVEEDAVMRWYNSEASKSGNPAEVKLREKATKFIEWLNEAEEEDSSDEEEDD